jgi:hypothetical protein
MKITAEPRSDQWNADDFIGGPRTFTIAGVKHGTAEQKYDVELVEGDGRVWRPPLTMLRLLMAAWGDDTAVWVGRRVTLYRDETVRFGADAVGGIRVSHMSDLPGGKRFSTKVTEKRGKRVAVSVEPLPDVAPTVQQITPDHERVIGEHIKRTGMTREGVLTAAREIATGPVSSARELTAAQADELIAFLASRPDAGTDPFPNVPTDDGDQSFPSGDAA